MDLLAGKTYDPSTAVNKVTTAALALTALDTTNLRLSFTIPSHGYVRVRMCGVLHGATTFPSIMLGVLEGSTVRGRVAPVQSLGNTAVATALVSVEVDFVISGLTPGAVNWDAAYGVETLIASTGLKYGGPNNTTANDNFGGFVFEIWDPMPISAVHTKLDTIIGRIPLALIGGRMSSHVEVISDGLLTFSKFSQNFWDAITSYVWGASVGVFGTISDSFGSAIAELWSRPAGSGGGLSAESTRVALGLVTSNLDAQFARITEPLQLRIYKNLAYHGYIFKMLDSNDGVTGKTGLTVTAERRINAGAYEACSNAAVEIGDGYYGINLTASDLNGDTVEPRFSGTGANVCNRTINTI